MQTSPPIETEEQLEDLLSEPTDEVIATLGRVPGDVVVLGVAGKMGPTLARMVRRGSDAAGVRRRVIGVARFSSGGREALESHGVETIACNLLDEAEVAALPDAPNVIFMAGRKFGSTGDEPTTWAMNAYVPAVVARRYAGRRIMAFSSGNIYGLVPAGADGSHEDDALNPVGEYAMSCLARERMFEYFSRTLATPMALVRLNYACELRYGVLVDLAQKIKEGEPIPLGMGYFNTIWQGDANALAVRALEHVAVPPLVVNLTGPDRLSVHEVSERLGQLMGRPVRFSGHEADTALLNDARWGLALLGTPRVALDTLLTWVARWVEQGGASLSKPTHFESREGTF